MTEMKVSRAKRRRREPERRRAQVEMTETGRQTIRRTPGSLNGVRKSDTAGL
jgi:hypothetical protein